MEDFIQNVIKYAFITSILGTIITKFINKEVEVLIEETKDGYSYGHTGNYLYVKINKELEHNTFVQVKVTKIDYPYCLAE